MTLPAVAGNTILASDFYQICQPSGNQEAGKYWLAGAGYTTGAVVSQYMTSTSQGATPVSMSHDTADHSPGGSLGSPSTGSLTSHGFQIFASFSAASNNGVVGGNYTIQY